ncbi:vacuolar protein sorting 8 [Lycorma delicatula]|uniref:vacuolar protein sorting 8 n=1 Tax=Lycorma delicatula TaxID=130591 RepID=UPI003F50EBD4
MNVNGDSEGGSNSILTQDLLNLDIVDLDDEEYHIPPVDKTPTLESILNDDQSSLLSEDELSNYLSPELMASIGDGGETASISSIGSATARRDKGTTGGTHSPTAARKGPMGGILRHVILKAVSSQLRSACERVNAGKPTVMAVTTMVSVGTAHGLVLLFDSSQTLKWCFEGDKEQGSVSCLALNIDCTRLLAGFAKGQLLMLDTADGKVLRTMTDVHTPYTAVLHVKFTDNPTLAVCSDSGGSVFELNFKRTLGVRGCDSKCLFSGSRGEVVCLEPLLLHQLVSHPLQGATLIAMATLSKVIVVSIRPSTRLLLTHSVKASQLSLPLLSWQFVIIQVADSSRVMDPVLAFARDSTIYFYQVSVESSGRIICMSLQQLNLGYSLISCRWMNARTLALLDTAEAFHLVDVRTREELESTDLSSVGLVYNSSHFKGLATGGNVSKAMALAGERACYNTVQSFGNQMLLLGTNSFHVISIRTWTERINHLIEQNMYAEALKLGMDFLKERGKAVLGLRGHRKVRQRLVRDKMIDTLLMYTDKVLEAGDAISYHEAISTIIDYSIQLDQKDVVFNKLWEGLDGDSGGQAIFLHSMENKVLEGKVNWLPPEIMQQLVLHLQHLENWKALEQCVLKVDVTCLDIEQVLTLCRQHNLHDALISIWNRAMGDYTTPIHELLPMLEDYLVKGQSSYELCRSLGNRLLVYLSCCLSGRAYPSGDIPSGCVDNVRQQVFKCLCNQHSLNAGDSETCYPYLRTLLRFDTREFLNALAIAFDDPQLSSQLRQRIVNILILVMVDGEGFLPTQVGWLFTFLAQQLSRPGPHCPLRVEQKHFERVVKYLTVPEENTLHDERQEAFQQLMLAGGLSHYSHDELLALARSAEFFQVCALLHEKKGEHGQVLRCYLLDNGRKHRVFSYLETSPHKDELQSAVIENIDALIDTNGVETGRTLYKYYPYIIPTILPQLSDLQLYSFLKGLLDEGNKDPALVTQYFGLLCKNNPEQAKAFVTSHENILTEKAVEMSKSCNLDEVTAVLLEKKGDYQEAFDLLLARLQTSIEQNEPQEHLTVEIVGLAQRGATVLDSKKSWLPLLQYLLKLKSHDLMQTVLSNSNLSLASELHLLMEHTNGTLGDLRSLITGLFDKCVHETRMLEATCQLQYKDLHIKLRETLEEMNKGQSIPPYCSSCKVNKDKSSLNKKILMFRCGHRYHIDCMETPDVCICCNKSDTPAPS